MTGHSAGNGVKIVFAILSLTAYFYFDKKPNMMKPVVNKVNPSKLTFIFILFIVAHMNLAIPVSREFNSGDICITNNGIHMAHHSDNQKVHDHRGFVQHAHYSHHSGHEKSIHELRMDCSMDMSSSGIYFPGGEHPFTYPVMWTSDAGILNRETVSFLQAKTSEGFIITPDYPPKFIS